MAGLHREQVQVRVDRIELHDREPDETAPIARREHRTVAIAETPLHAVLVPRPRQAVLDELARHRRDAKGIVCMGQT